MRRRRPGSPRHGRKLLLHLGRTTDSHDPLSHPFQRTAVLRSAVLLLPHIDPAKTPENIQLEMNMSLGTILLVILILLLLGALPTWPYSSGWGYYPSGGLGLVLLIIVILALTGRL